MSEVFPDDGGFRGLTPVRALSSASGVRGERSVTVDTSRARCTEWTPGRGRLFTVLPFWLRLLMSAPGDRDPVAGAGTRGRDGELVASAIVAARFLPIWIATAALVVVAAIIAPSAPEHVVGVRPPLHDDSRHRGARADARGHAGRHRPLDPRRHLLRREPDRRRERGVRPRPGGRDARVPRPRAPASASSTASSSGS